LWVIPELSVILDLTQTSALRCNSIKDKNCKIQLIAKYCQQPETNKCTSEKFNEL